MHSSLNGQRDYDEKRIASLINSGDGALLSAVALTHSLSALSDEKRASFLDRGLVTEKNGRAELTPPSLLASSLYPLLGDGSAERERYPESFHQMFLSRLAEGTARRTKRSRIGAVTRISFPSLSAEEADRLTLLTAEAFERLGIIEDGRNGWRVVRENADAFLALPLLSRLSYILDSDRDRHSVLCALTLLSAISSLRVRDADKVLSLIREYSGYPVAGLDRLQDLQILKCSGDRISGRDFGPTESTLVVSSDFSILAGGITDIPLYLFAEPSRAGVISEWMITKDSVRTAISYGLTGSEIVAMLEKKAEKKIAPSVVSRILYWEEMLSSARAERCIMLRVSGHAERLMKALSPRLERHVLANPSPALYLMRAETGDEWRPVLEEAGIEIMGDTSAEEERKAAKREFMPCTLPLPLPLRRKIPFSEELYDSLLDTDDAYRKALVMSGFILDCSQKTPPLPRTVLGLDYQEKKRIITEAVLHGTKIYAEFVDGSVIIARPYRSEREGSAMMNGRDVDIAKIWKTAALPLSVASITLDRKASDNDSL